MHRFTSRNYIPKIFNKKVDGKIRVDHEGIVRLVSGIIVPETTPVCTLLTMLSVK